MYETVFGTACGGCVTVKARHGTLRASCPVRRSIALLETMLLPSALALLAVAAAPTGPLLVMPVEVRSGFSADQARLAEALWLGALRQHCPTQVHSQHEAEVAAQLRDLQARAGVEGASLGQVALSVGANELVSLELTPHGRGIMLVASRVSPTNGAVLSRQQRETPADWSRLAQDLDILAQHLMEKTKTTDARPPPVEQAGKPRPLAAVAWWSGAAVALALSFTVSAVLGAMLAGYGALRGVDRQHVMSQNVHLVPFRIGALLTAAALGVVAILPWVALGGPAVAAGLAAAGGLAWLRQR